MQAMVIALSLSRSDGRLIYTLDDVYIHLAMAESILDGGYGINPGEYSSPSSSMLYPFLLASALLVGFGDWSPLVFSLPASWISVWILSGMVWRGLNDFFSGAIPFAFAMLGPAVVFLINAVALPMTGMEHSIHVFAAILVMAGLLNISERRSTGLWMTIVGIAICAVIRFEGLALAFFASFALFMQGFRRPALMVLVTLLTIIGVWALVMNTIGLPFLPSSVLVKSKIVASAHNYRILDVLKGIWTNIEGALGNRWGILLGLASAFIVPSILSQDAKHEPRRPILCVGFMAMIAHIAFGDYFWFCRYEVYIVAIMVITVLALPTISGPKLSHRSSSLAIAVMVSFYMIALPYVQATISTPKASANIYQQQYQMHRFSREFFPARVALNDLGWVAYKNDAYILDLWGLGSEQARKISSGNLWTSELLQSVTSHHQIVYAMIYQRWFMAIPAEWCHIADLTTSQVTSAEATVSFYLIDESKSGDMRIALEEFGKTLPSGAHLTRFECGALNGSRG